MKELMDKWLELKEVERKAKEEREAIEASMYLAVNTDINETSQATFNYDDYKLVIKPNWAVKVDQEKAKEFPEYFKTKYEMSYSQYLKSGGLKIIDDAVEIKQNKPTFTVTRG